MHETGALVPGGTTTWTFSVAEPTPEAEPDWMAMLGVQPAPHTSLLAALLDLAEDALEDANAEDDPPTADNEADATENADDASGCRDEREEENRTDDAEEETAFSEEMLDEDSIN